MSTTYQIVRHYYEDDHPDHLAVIRSGLTLEEAQAHCRRDDTHEMGPDGLAVWFDGYQEERHEHQAARRYREVIQTAGQHERNAFTSERDNDHAGAARLWMAAVGSLGAAASYAAEAGDEIEAQDAIDRAEYARTRSIYNSKQARRNR